MIACIITLNSLLLVFFAYEIYLLIIDKKQGKGKTEKDRGTRYFNFLSIIIGITFSGVISILIKADSNKVKTISIFCIGIVVMIFGLFIRIWSVFTLGKSFRTTVEVHKDQEIIQKGPYKLIRHPSYTGLLMICLGYGIAVQNWLSLIVVIILPLAALLYRIYIEEEYMANTLGSKYEDYRLKTKKLIPWIW